MNIDIVTELSLIAPLGTELTRFHHLRNHGAGHKLMIFHRKEDCDTFIFECAWRITINIRHSLITRFDDALEIGGDHTVVQQICEIRGNEIPSGSVLRSGFHKFGR